MSIGGSAIFKNSALSRATLGSGILTSTDVAAHFLNENEASGCFLLFNMDVLLVMLFRWKTSRAP